MKGKTKEFFENILKKYYINFELNNPKLYFLARLIFLILIFPISSYNYITIYTKEMEYDTSYEIYYNSKFPSSVFFVGMK